MSFHPEPTEQQDIDLFLTFFEGSAPEDVSHARQLWRSMSMLPPLESRLVSADVRQRLPVSRPRRGSTAAASPRPSTPEPPGAAALRLQQRQEERQRYAAMAEQRRELLALLRRRREQRIHKELLSGALKAKVRPGKDTLQKTSECEVDKELVKELL